MYLDIKINWSVRPDPVSPHGLRLALLERARVDHQDGPDS